MFDFYTDCLVAAFYFRQGRTLYAWLLVASLGVLVLLEVATGALSALRVPDIVDQRPSTPVAGSPRAVVDEARSEWRHKVGGHACAWSVVAATMAAMPPVVAFRAIFAMLVDPGYVPFDYVALMPPLLDALPECVDDERGGRLDALRGDMDAVQQIPGYAGPALWALRHAQLVEIAAEVIPQLLVQFYAFTYEWFRREGSNDNSVGENGRTQEPIVIAAMVLSAFSATSILTGFVFHFASISARALGALYFLGLLLSRLSVIVAWYVEYGFHANIYFATSVLARYAVFGPRSFSAFGIDSLRGLVRFLIDSSLCVAFPLIPSPATCPEALIDPNAPAYPLEKTNVRKLLAFAALDFVLSYTFLLATPSRKGRTDIDRNFCLLFGLVPFATATIVLFAGGLIPRAERHRRETMVLASDPHEEIARAIEAVSKHLEQGDGAAPAQPAATSSRQLSQTVRQPDRPSVLPTDLPRPPPRPHHRRRRRRSPVGVRDGKRVLFPVRAYHRSLYAPVRRIASETQQEGFGLVGAST